MESFLVDLKKNVQCSLCNNQLIEPKILPCFHTFCKLCIQRRAQLHTEVNVFKCPKCSSETFLRATGSMEDLQPSPLHSRILRGLSLIEGEKVCSVSERHPAASWYCFDCDHPVCEECNESHSFFIKDHKVVRLADLKKEETELIITRENPCKNHPHHRIELFCEDCDEMICVSCLKDDQIHKDHKTMSLQTFASIKKAVLSKHLQALEHLDDPCKKQEQEEIANKIKQQGEKAKNEVEENTKRIIKLLQENERDLLTQIDEKLDTATRNLNIIHHIQAVKEYVKNMMKIGLASEMINIQETQCTEKFIFNPIPLSSRVVFFPNQDLEQQVKTGLGEIQTHCKTDHTMSTILVEAELEAARQQKLILKTKTSTGMDSINAGDVVDVQISPEEYVRKEETDVRTGGRIEVGFMAKVTGQLTADVQVNGSRLSNSPLVMNVKPQDMKITGHFSLNGVDTESHNLTGIAVNRDNSRITVADASSHCVHMFSTNGDLVMKFGSRGNSQGQLSGPEGLAFLNDTDIVIADWGNQRICIVNTTTGALLKTLGKQRYGNGEFCCPIGVNINAEDGDIIVTDCYNHRVQVFNSDGDYQYQFSLPKGAKFDPICTVRHEGLFYVSDHTNHVIHVFEKRGEVPTRISTISGDGSADGQVFSPWGLAVDNDHHLLVCDRANNCIQKFTLAGRLVGKTNNEINNPVFTAELNDGRLLVNSLRSGVWCVASRQSLVNDDVVEDDDAAAADVVVVDGGGGGGSV